MDRDGQVHGPIWLSRMRDLWKKGRLMMSTEVRRDGEVGWEAVEFHPEIFEAELRLPEPKAINRTKSDPVRLLVWTVLLFLAYATWVVVHWEEGTFLRLDGGAAPSASTAK